MPELHESVAPRSAASHQALPASCEAIVRTLAATSARAQVIRRVASLVPIRQIATCKHARRRFVRRIVDKLRVVLSRHRSKEQIVDLCPMSCPCHNCRTRSMLPARFLRLGPHVFHGCAQAECVAEIGPFRRRGAQDRTMHGDVWSMAPGFPGGSVQQTLCRSKREFPRTLYETASRRPQRRSERHLQPGCNTRSEAEGSGGGFIVYRHRCIFVVCVFLEKSAYVVHPRITNSQLFTHSSYTHLGS